MLNSGRRRQPTQRQAEILRLILDHGLGNKQIARQLGITESTVRTHLERYFRIAKQHTRAGAIGQWLRSRQGEA